MTKVIKGNIIFTKVKDSFEVYENSYLIIENGLVKAITHELSDEFIDLPVEDFGNHLIIPGFVDLHLHAPQWPNMGIGYDEKLISWLNLYTFPLESTFDNIDIARINYTNFIKELKLVGTTRACIFATRHLHATKLLISMLRESGIGAYVGKVNMDRNAESPLIEKTKDSIEETLELIKEDSLYKSQIHNPLVNYILTPRFVPSTTPELMTALGEIADEFNLPIQSHLDENPEEITWVKNLHPEISSFAHVYEHFNLLKPNKTIMAHCIYMTDEEIQLIKDKQVYIAHCAASNNNITSGIMPLRRYLDKELLIGIGSDISGGHTLDIRENMIMTIQASKQYHVIHPEYKPISISEAFYLATKGGGNFFGKVGSFELGYEFDALIIDDTNSNKKGLPDEPLTSRLEKFIYTGNPDNIIKRYVRGNEISLD